MGSSGSRGPPCPQDFFKIMQFSANFKEENSYFEQILGSGSPHLGSKLCWAPCLAGQCPLCLCTFCKCLTLISCNPMCLSMMSLFNCGADCQESLFSRLYISIAEKLHTQQTPPVVETLRFEHCTTGLSGNE